VREIEIHPEAYNELKAARDWYEKQAINLGDDFLAEIDTGVEKVKMSPALWSPYHGFKGIRRFFIHRFPFSVIYRHNENKIQILAIAHLRRKPGYWKKRMK
jgi:toxin ParE1/3/4